MWIYFKIFYIFALKLCDFTDLKAKGEHKAIFFFGLASDRAIRKQTYPKNKEAAWKLFVESGLYRIQRIQFSLKANNEGYPLIKVDLKAQALFKKNLLTMPNDYISANSARLGLCRNSRAWSQCAVDFDRPNQETTKS
jgi:hypothetical protein